MSLFEKLNLFKQPDKNKKKEDNKNKIPKPGDIFYVQGKLRTINEAGVEVRPTPEQLDAYRKKMEKTEKTNADNNDLTDEEFENKVQELNKKMHKINDNLANQRQLPQEEKLEKEISEKED